MLLRTLCLTSCLVLCFGPCEAYAQAERPLRIRLFEESEPHAVTVRAEVAPLSIYAGEYDNPITELAPGQQAVVTAGNGQMIVEVPGQGLFASSLRIEPKRGARTALEIDSGTRHAPAHAYEGKLFLSPVDAGGWKLRIVNALPFESYVAALVAGSYGYEDREGAQAMAVVLRTHALASLNHAADVDRMAPALARHYVGASDVTPLLREVLARSAGEVLTYDGDLIHDPSVAGPGTDVGRSRPYLRQQAPTHVPAGSDAGWQSTVSRPYLLKALTDRYQFDVTGFYIGRQSADAHVRTIDLRRNDGRRVAVPAEEFRLLVTERFGDDVLPGLRFTARRDGDRYVFEGRGTAQDAGFTREAVRVLAQQGKNYREILDHFYTGVALETMDGRPLPQAADAEPGRTPRKKGRIGW